MGKIGEIQEESPAVRSYKGSAISIAFKNIINHICKAARTGQDVNSTQQGSGWVPCTYISWWKCGQFVTCRLHVVPEFGWGSRHLVVVAYCHHP